MKSQIRQINDIVKEEKKFMTISGVLMHHQKQHLL